LPLLRPGDEVWAGWERGAARLLPVGRVVTPEDLDEQTGEAS
jgi:hypothetical protein